MFFCLSKRYDVRPSWALCVNHHNNICLKKTKADQAFFAIGLPLVLTGHSEVIPNCIASNEIKPMVLDVELALWFVPCENF